MKVMLSGPGRSKIVSAGLHSVSAKSEKPRGNRSEPVPASRLVRFPEHLSALSAFVLLAARNPRCHSTGSDGFTESP